MEPLSPQPHGPFAALPKMMKFYEEGRFCDVKIQIEDIIIPCQRSVLAAQSEFFDTMFQSDFKEGNSGNDEPIILRGVNAVAFKEIMNSMRTGNVNVNDTNAHLLLRANDFLRIRTTFIEERCYQYISSSSCSHPLSSAVDILSFASSTKKQRFVDLMCEHILKHLDHFSQDATFMEIPFEILNTILLKSKGYARTFLDGRGNTLLRIIIRWVNHSRTVRCQHREVLMKNINSSCISTDYTISLLNEYENIVDIATNRGDNVEWLTDAYALGAEIKFATGTTCTFKVNDLLYDLRKASSGYGPEPSKESPSYRIRDLEWFVLIRRWSSNLSFYARFIGDRDTCCADVEFRILSQKEGIKDLVKNLSNHTFYARFEGGVGEFIGWNDIIDEEKGYIRNKSVIFQIHVSF